MNKVITASMQDYLEVILNLNDYEEAVRVTDIAKKLDIAKASVNQSINKLKKLGLVKHEVYGPVELTEKGRKVAEDVRMRHNKLYNFLVNILGVDSQTAEKDACLMEHVVSEQTMIRLTEFLIKTEK
ncbi:metal-dependent transcriptional regulator [Clostridium sp. 'deep sea']|uniref:metal-dependent transcriptional regulator n=1 Tax=Clostridium sp. 'deep sea' TaxID=2779445 RepID=UPI0018964600|nr:metal-dependent transcriptional regulator [Clostridium sp. 'deep sea']QOR35516.1 metal-dependent transcriptional regulator [Clostridium sp. 'deep sea']